MKVFKKITVVAVIALTSLFGGQVIPVEAKDSVLDEVEFTSYSTADLTRNGTVDSNDYSVMDQVLRGTRYVGYNFHMDVDRNNIVSRADASHILSYMVGIISENCVYGTPNNYFGPEQTQSYYAPIEQSISCVYKKHVYATNTTSQYTLSMTEAAFPTNISYPDTVIGNDSRIAEYDTDMKSGICYLSCGGTGFVVGDHTIATVAHGCYDSNGWVNNLYVQFPSSSNVSNGFAPGYVDFSSTKYYVKEAHISKAFYDSCNDNEAYYFRVPYDYALITVSESLSNRYHFDLGIPYDIYSSNSPFYDYDIHITGYPNDLANSNNSQGCYLYTGVGQILPLNITDRLCYDTDIMPGESGAPIYVKEKVSTVSSAYPTVIGIQAAQTTSYNSGSFFTPIHLKFFMNNTNISY